MNVNDLRTYRNEEKKSNFIFRAELFNKAIWGDMGEDSAQISVSINNPYWHYSFIRTQSGDPSPFDDYVCNIIDQYEKDIDDEQFYDILAMHALLADFEQQYKASLV